MVNFAFEGIRGTMPSEEVDFDLPDYPDEDLDQSGEDPTGEQGQGGVDPMTNKDHTRVRAEPFDYGTDSMGRTYPRDKYGYRIVPGSR